MSAGVGVEVAAATRERVQAAFLDLMELAPEAQAHALQALRASDPEVAREVGELLGHHAAAKTFLHTRAWDQVPPPTDALQWGALRLGDYTIVGVLGAGGMGLVYLAEQHRPRRHVAIKVMLGGRRSRLFVNRFLHEAEILGRLQHPGIALIIEAGIGEQDATTPDQEPRPVPFIAMEYVDGLPLLDHAREHNLTTRRRVELMVEICDAVEHAHRRGVIHLDLKPANILVDRSGRPKVLDFGIARLADAGEAPTMGGIVAGTLPYMSPEQVEGDRSRIDTRADVYALGAILYELLSDKLPIELADVPLGQAAPLIREARPRPLGSIDARLAGDLEAIAAAALAKEPDRRYASVAELRDDLARHLDARPIEARRESRRYVLSRLARRHRWPILGAAAALAGVVGFAVFAGVAANRNARLATSERLARITADQSLSAARSAREQADIANASLRKALYYSRIGYAQAGAAIADTRGVRQALAACAPEDRNWEWRYLDRLVNSATYRSQPFTFGRGALAAVHPGLPAIFTHHFAGIASIDLATGQILSMARQNDPFADVDLAPDGRVLFSLLPSTTIVASLPDFTTLLEFTSPQGSIRACAFSHDAARAYILLERFGVAVHDAQTGALLSTFPLVRPGEYAYILEPSPDGTLLAVGTSERLLLLDPATGEVRSERPTRSLVHCLSFARDKPLLAFGTADRFARVFDLNERREIFAAQAHSNKVTAIALSHDGSHLASGSTDTSIILYELPSGRELARRLGHESTLAGLAFSPDGSTLYSAARDGAFLAWPVAGDASILRPEPPIINPTCTAQDGTRRLVGGSNGHLVAFEPDGSQTRLLGLAGHVNQIEAHQGIVYAVDNKDAFAAWRGSQRLWLTRIPSPPSTFSFTPQRIALATSSGQLVLLNPTDGSITHTFNIHTTGVFDVVDLGDRFVASSQEGPLLEIAPDGSVLRSLPAHDTVAWRLTLSPDRSRFISCGEDGRIIAWSAETLRPILEYPRQSTPTYGAAFTPDGSRFATGGFDNSVRVWSASEPVEVLRLIGHTSLVGKPSFSDDGLDLLTCSGDGEIRVWSARPREAVPSPP